MRLEDLADKLGVDFRGPGDYEIAGLRDLERLNSDAVPEEHRLYFVENMKVLRRHPRADQGGAVLTTESLAGRFPRALVAADASARLVFIRLLELFDPSPAFEAGISTDSLLHPEAKIDPGATVLPGAVVMRGAVVGRGCRLYPGVVIEPYAELKEGVVLYPNVVIGARCVVGRRCIVHGGTVIGADGFGFFDHGGERYKVPQIGTVLIEDDVEIGAGCTVDRATIETTVIGARTKLDDQVHVGHNCRIGRSVYLVGNTAIGGSVEMGDGAMISGMVIVKDHLKIAPGTVVMGFSAVAQDTEANKAYFGVPARPAKEMHRMNSSLAKLPELLNRVRALESAPAVPASAD